MTDYEKLLDEAYLKVKQTDSTGERFKVPTVEGRFQGKKTILTNFAKIAEILRRPVEHMQKFISKELATQIVMDSDRAVLNKKVPSKNINPKIEQYAKEFVICKECGKPDTQIVKENRMNFLHCLACGAKNPIRAKV